MRIAIVAGEISGDLLASRLIMALKRLRPDCSFEGVAGPEMQAAGCKALYPMEKLSVMGLAEVLKHLPELLAIRRKLLKHWRDNPPDLFIGVDAPDFNLPLARKLHQHQIKTVHYVSPSIWAWREYRVNKLQGHIDLMLVLFPFEVDFYRKHAIPAQFVGHPFADEIHFNPAMEPARAQLGLSTDQPLLGILPGSRSSEIQLLAPLFFQVVGQLHQQYPAMQFAVPVAQTRFRPQLMAFKHEHAPQATIHFLEGQSRTLMEAADLLLMASGTAVLEGMLTGRLMVVGHKISPLTWRILQLFKLLKVKHVTLPNNLAQDTLIPEYLQDNATVTALAQAVKQQFTMSDAQKTELLARFQQLQQQLRCDASHSAAQALIDHFAKHQ